ncbi:MAG TPA: hypothetical protein VJS64_15115, partial [Pyrinomonadaceae bacterium]|nr:hypothetical protein [Pyrinomonadaceae bacterium]
MQQRLGPWSALRGSLAAMALLAEATAGTRDAGFWMTATVLWGVWGKDQSTATQLMTALTRAKNSIEPVVPTGRREIGSLPQ